ncbi:hypothetical protein VNO77_04963 [Canavalia gladiata]|uniref:Uncharacterized protein n=1 Tax=Canavalia gladiata TaxID=3824 RepID=A0AAN9R9J6_CANGL
MLSFHSETGVPHVLQGSLSFLKTDRVLFHSMVLVSFSLNGGGPFYTVESLLILWSTQNVGELAIKMWKIKRSTWGLLKILRRTCTGYPLLWLV